MAFRSKEKLLDLIMMENLRQFLQGVILIFNDRETSLEKMVEKVVGSYIDMLIMYPDLPLFVLNEMRSNPDKFAARMDAETGLSKTFFSKQVSETFKGKKSAHLHQLHFIANMIGLTVFPFVASPLLRKIGNVNQQQFLLLMEERKKLIPVWIKAMMKVR